MAKSEGSARGKNKNKGQRMRTALHGSSGRGHTPIDPRIQNEIGKHLRAAYDDVINEPVPEKFIELLQKLEQSSARKG